MSNADKFTNTVQISQKKKKTQEENGRAHFAKSHVILVVLVSGLGLT